MRHETFPTGSGAPAPSPEPIASKVTKGARLDDKIAVFTLTFVTLWRSLVHGLQHSAGQATRAGQRLADP